jgi:DNA polymerase-3 subunit delta'
MQLRGHAPVLDQFRRAIARGRLASTFLFVGPEGIGKRTFALQLAQGLLCERVPEAQLAPCGECPSCRQVAALSHPDVHLVSRPADKAVIPIKALIGEDETRMQEGLCYDIAARPYSGRRKIAIIDDADYLNKEGANCLLKTLEEPPPKSLLILIGTSEQRQLPTIRSRCQIVRFQRLADADVAELLLEAGHCEDPAAAALAAARGAGSVTRAALWCDESLVEFRGQLLEILSRSEIEIVASAKLTSQFVDAAGKESAAKRARLRLVVSLAEEFYRGLLLSATGSSAIGRPVAADPELAKATERAGQWLAGAEAAAACLDVCLEASAAIDANVNQATFLEWWFDELGETARLGRSPALGAGL